MREDDFPEAFLFPSCGLFFAMKEKSLQKLRPAGWDAVCAGRGYEHRSGKVLVVLRKQYAGAAMSCFNQGEEEL